MKFRIATNEDVNKIMEIVKQAQQFLKDQGINQWQNNYPDKETIINDVVNDNCYVIADEQTIVAFGAVIFTLEPTYAVIDDGNWLNDDQYCVIHRLAVNQTYRNQKIASLFIKQVKELCISKGIDNIRIDTHQDNLIMQKMLKNNGFRYCGIIYLLSKDIRLAYQLVIDQS